MKISQWVVLFSGLFSLTISSGAVSSAAVPEFKLPRPDVETLPNGLKLVWFTSDKLPIVDLVLTVKSGGRDDLPGKSGTAELTAATIDRGAGGLTTRQIADQVESLGASRSMSAEDDFFNVKMHGLATDADTLLDLMAKIALHPDFSQEEIHRERARLIDTWNRLADYGDTLVDLAFGREMSQNTPYARGTVLSAKELAKVDRADVVKWWQKNVVPGNSVLMIVGKVDRKEYRDRINSLFGNWKGAAPKKASIHYRSLKFTPKANEVLLLDRPNLNQAQVRIGFRVPLAQDPRHYPITVANALLGEYFHSRLNSLIRDQLGLTYGISSEISYSRELAALTINAATRNETTAELIQKTFEVLRGLKSEPIPDDEVATAKDYLVGGFPLSTATLEAVAGRWLLSDLYDLGPERTNEFVPKISAVTAKDVSQAIASAFPVQRAMIAVSGDAKDIEPILKKAGFKVHRVSAATLIGD